MALRPGYKQTEVGVIPKGWEITNLASVCCDSMQNGVFYQPSRKGYGVKLINVGDLYKQTPIDSDSLELFDANEDEKERFRVKNGDLFFTRSSVVPSGIAQCNIYNSSQPESVVFDSHIIRVRPDPNKVVSSYLFRFCVASIARKYLVSHAKTGTMTTIDQGVLGKCPVLLPPLPEQRTIAAALSDVDALITALDALIAKKRLIKQGAMQELLTGRRRLPGFAGDLRGDYKRTEVGVIPGDWQVKLFGDIVSIRKQKFDPHRMGAYSFCIELEHIGQGSGQILGSGEAIVGSSIKVLFRKNDVLFGKLRAYLRKYWLADRDGVASTEIWPLVANTQLTSAQYVFLLVQTEGFIEAASIAYGTHMPRSDWNIIKNYFVALPSLPEQCSIAEVLSDMDAEITALERKRHKTRLLKQGMMQELLTGKTRLL